MNSFSRYQTPVLGAQCVVQIGWSSGKIYEPVVTTLLLCSLKRHRSWTNCFVPLPTQPLWVILYSLNCIGFFLAVSNWFHWELFTCRSVLAMFPGRVRVLCSTILISSLSMNDFSLPKPLPDYETQQISFQNENRLTDPFKVSVKTDHKFCIFLWKNENDRKPFSEKKCTASIYEFKYMFSVKKRKNNNIKLKQKVTSIQRHIQIVSINKE